MIEYATDDGLFDLHWMDRCPLLARRCDSRRSATVLASAAP
jgi:hypothetical protein